MNACCQEAARAYPEAPAERQRLTVERLDCRVNLDIAPGRRDGGRQTQQRDD